MRLQHEHDTGPEMRLRRELHKRGLRFRLHRKPIPQLRREADIVFPRQRIAVFVDGCYWHGCPQHATWPRANQEFWRAKIESNRRRDADTDVKLRDAGWVVMRVWEHDDPGFASDEIGRIVRG